VWSKLLELGSQNYIGTRIFSCSSFSFIAGTIGIRISGVHVSGRVGGTIFNIKWKSESYHHTKISFWVKISL
jgi:hypothetical protein